MKKSLKQWCEENNKGYLLDEWMQNENLPITTENVTYGSEKEVRWKCKVCGYIWEKKIQSRTSCKTGCPICKKKERIEKTNKKRIEKNGSLEEKVPEILKYWDYEKNQDILPSQVTPKSNKEVWWKCDKCGKSYKLRVGLRVNGHECGNCKSKKRIDSIIAKNGSLYDKAPELEVEWCKDRNDNLTMKDITPYSNKKYAWKCKECGHIWLASAATRLKGHGCPSCSGLIANENNNLKVIAPKLASEWHPIKNR